MSRREFPGGTQVDPSEDALEGEQQAQVDPSEDQDEEAEVVE
jgi:hypothetical protein